MKSTHQSGRVTLRRGAWVPYLVLLVMLLATVAAAYYVVSHPDVEMALQTRHVPLILLVGTLIGFVLFVIVLAQTRARAMAERAAARLRRSEMRFRTMVEQSPLSTQIFSPDGQTTKVNHAWETLWGVTLDRLGGYNILEDHQLVEKGIMPFIKKGFDGEATAIPAIRYDPEQTIPGKTINEEPARWVQAFIYPVKDDAGRVREVVLVHEDITERKRAEEKLRYQLDLTSTITANAAEGLCLIDAEGRLTFMNRAAETILGWTEEEFKGRIFHDTVHYRRPDGSPYPMSECPLMEVLKTGATVRNVEDVCFRKDGTPVPVFCSCAPITVDGEVTGAVLAMHDITERLRLEEQLRTRADELAQANRLKDEFLATISHELRTPLTAILGWATMLRTDEFDKEATERALAIIERNAQAQAQLVGDLLDVSRIITGKLRLDARPLDLTHVIDAAIDSARPAIEAKEISLRVALDPAGGLISGDPDRLQQVVWNLLANAIKFTPKGGEIDVRLDRAGSHMRVTVADNGPGISAEFLPYVFDRFRQADGRITREHGGLGLGLSIVRHLVELHGGTIRVESPGEGRGSTFTIELPLTTLRTAPNHADASTDAAPRGGNDDDGGVALAASETRGALRGIRVLVVDDDHDTRELLALMLRKQGAEVETVAAVAEALEAIRRVKPDVLVSDIGMPGQDGYEFIRHLRALPPDDGGRIPAAALTAYARTEDRTRALSAGYQAHIPKPVEPAELTAVIASLARRNGNY